MTSLDNDYYMPLCSFVMVTATVFFIQKSYDYFILQIQALQKQV